LRGRPPSFVSLLMFSEMVSRDLPFLSGMIIPLFQD
jgi:hypothetical protein